MTITGGLSAAPGPGCIPAIMHSDRLRQTVRESAGISLAPAEALEIRHRTVANTGSSGGYGGRGSFGPKSAHLDGMRIPSSD